MIFPKQFANDYGKQFTPVYVPGETFSFFINSEYPLTDPDFLNFELQIYNGDSVMVKNAFATLSKCEWFTAAPVNPYSIYSEFVFPQIPNGEYFFVIKDIVNDVEKCRSNPILVEQQYLERTYILKFRNTVNRSSYYYENIPYYYNIVRIPITKSNFNIESERSQYRNASDRRLRNYKSYLDYGYKLDAFNLDEAAAKAIAEILECNDVRINNVIVTPKTQLTNEEDNKTIISKASFETYVDQVQNPIGSLEAFADIIIECGDSIFVPPLIIDQN